MTFRSWLGRTIRDLLAEELARQAAPPTPNPESTPSSPTSNGKASQPTSAEPATLVQLVEMMGRQQEATMKEVRGMVMDILQGRERPPMSEEEQASVSRTRFDPPDYDSPGMEGIPGGIAEVFARHDQEDIEFRTSHSEPELLASQLEVMRLRAGMDPQGPSAAPSFSKESIGLRPEDLRFPE